VHFSWTKNCTKSRQNVSRTTSSPISLVLVPAAKMLVISVLISGLPEKGVRSAIYLDAVHLTPKRYEKENYLFVRLHVINP